MADQNHELVSCICVQEGIPHAGMLVDVVGDKLDCSVIFFVKFATNYTETNFEKSNEARRTLFLPNIFMY